MDKSTVALAAATVLLVVYVLYEQTQANSSGSKESAPLGRSCRPPLGKSRKALGRSRKSTRGQATSEFCKGVSISSPDFARCATELGTQRTTLPGNPARLAHNINTSFVNDNFSPNHAAAFPFRAGDGESTTSSGLFKSKNGTLVANDKASLGAAVSPSAMGASREEMLQSTKRVVPVKVFSNTGGNLNLLHPLE